MNNKNSIQKDENIKFSKRSGKISLMLGIVIALVLGGTVLASAMIFINGDKAKIAKAFTNLEKELSKEFIEISKNNEVSNKIKEIFNDSFNIDFTIGQGIMSGSGSITNDKKSEILYTGGSIFGMNVGGVYISNEQNYLEVLDTAYDFDVENGIYKLINWAIDENKEFLEEDALNIIESVENEDLSYDTLTTYDSAVDEKIQKEISKYTLDTLMKEELLEVEESIFINNKEDVASKYAIPIDIEEYIRKLFEIRDKHTPKELLALQPSSDETLRFFDHIEFSNSEILFTIYDNKVVGLGLNTDVVDKLYGESIEFTLLFNFKSTKEMLNNFEYVIKSGEMESAFQFENDLFNEDKIGGSMKIIDLGKEVGKLSFNWDYTLPSDNISILFEEYEDEFSSEVKFTLGVIDDKVTSTYTDVETGVVGSLVISKLEDSVTLPAQSTYLYDMTYNEFVEEISKLMDGMF